MDDDNKTQIAIIIIGIIIVIIIIIIGSFLVRFIGNNDKEETQILDQEIYLDIIPRTNYLIEEINYKVKENNIIISEGIIKRSIIERINNLKNNTNYTIELENPDYYFANKDCNTIHKECIIDLQKIGDIQIHIIKIKDNFYRIIIYIEEGIINQPEICLGESSEKVIDIDLKNDKDIELLQIPIPTEHKIFYDKCYRLLPKEEIKQRIIADIVNEFDFDIRNYNKEFRTKYSSFQNVTVTDQEILDFPVQSLSEGFYHYNLYLKLNDRSFSSTDKLNFLMLDSKKEPIKKNLNIS